MENAGSVRPALLADIDEGIIYYLSESIGDERANQNLGDITRLIFNPMWS